MEYQVIVVLLTERFVKDVLVLLPRLGLSVRAGTSDNSGYSIAKGRAGTLISMLVTLTGDDARLSEVDSIKKIRSDLSVAMSKEGIQWVAHMVHKHVSLDWSIGNISLACNEHEDCKEDETLSRACSLRKVLL